MAVTASSTAGASPTRPVTLGPLPRAYSTPECRTGADRWPDLHQMCSAPGYRDHVLGWVPVKCGCDCHAAAEKGRVSAEKVIHDAEWDGYRIRKPDGVIVDTEYGGYPCGWDTRTQAEDAVERRAELHAHYRELRASGFPGLSAWCAP